LAGVCRIEEGETHGKLTVGYYPAVIVEFPFVLDTLRYYFVSDLRLEDGGTFEIVFCFIAGDSIQPRCRVVRYPIERPMLRCFQERITCNIFGDVHMM